MNNSKCILCSSGDLSVYIQAKDVDTEENILKCKKCGLVFFASFADRKFNDSYWDKGGEFGIYKEENVESGFESEFKKRLRKINSLKTKGKLLDIGCGIGSFLCLARSAGWEAVGVEISRPAAEYARKKHSLDIYEGTVENCALESYSIDVVTMWDVIEHIQNPIAALAAIENKLKPEGLLVIKAPNEKNLFRSVCMLLYKLSLRKIHFLLKYVYYTPHYFYYDKKTIQKLLEKFGFKVIEIENDQTNFNFAKEKLNLYFNKFCSRKLILMLLPIAFMLSRIFRLQNKMIVYAVKN